MGILDKSASESTGKTADQVGAPAKPGANITTANTTLLGSKPQEDPSADEGGGTTNTANVKQPESATTTDLDRLTQSQAGDNEGVGSTGENAKNAAEATGSATRTSDIDQLAALKAKETADAGLEQKLKLQADTSGQYDAGGNFLEGLGATLARNDQESDSTSYTSHPTKSLKLGKFQFENSTLTLKGDEVAEFDKLLDSQPAFIKNGVKKIDTDAAGKLAKQYLDQNRMIQGIDNSGNGLTRETGSSI